MENVFAESFLHFSEITKQPNQAVQNSILTDETKIFPQQIS